MFCCGYCKKKDDLRNPLYNLYCFDCGSYFNSVKELEAHRKIVHKDKYKVVKCSN